jgi:exonuclease III
VATNYKIATLNINGLTSHTRLVMLGDFLRRQEIDVMYLQKVTQPNVDTLRGYVGQTNIGTNERGTAIVTRENIPLTNVHIPSGRGIAAELQGVWLVNIYAPSGAEKKKEESLQHRSSTLIKKTYRQR